ncbi:hypothetical protein LO771_18555 [Streptacidiphilus sp. ASG 303]|uniref:hypothetical protein n=1 Tax=Streptacidiphilus sp. ASG 303 TaxID=2896847 RepID=UPI001E4D944F|nr:hypothetical protein [Streptacidiphilus sp. ASG 303]MCD0484340.1 hypothetical protein [Streptacidiphilus sp. ASG 303]
MLPDALHADLPDRIAAHARGMLQAGEVLRAAAPAKVGRPRMPYALLPATCYLALTDRRLIGFLATPVKALPGRVWFERPVSEVRPASRPRQIEVLMDDGRKKTMHLSPTHREAADSLLEAVAGR